MPSPEIFSRTPRTTLRNASWTRRSYLRRSWLIPRPQPAAGARVGGFCCPVPPEPRLLLMQQQRVRRYRSHLENGPMTVVPCRAKTTPLPRASILFRPHDTGRRAGGLVEAPGTAPGSATLIPCGVYRHSRVLPDSVQYSRVAGPLKGKHRACGGRRVVLGGLPKVEEPCR